MKKYIIILALLLIITGCFTKDNSKKIKIKIEENKEVPIW